jgi:hypothetical protein
MEERFEIIVSNSRTPIVRLGQGLWSLAVAGLAILLVPAAAADMGVSPFVRGVIATAMVCLSVRYCGSFISSLVIVDGIVSIVTATSSITYRVSDIARVRILTMPASYYQLVYIRGQGDLFGRVFQYVLIGFDVKAAEDQLRARLEQRSKSS